MANLTIQTFPSTVHVGDVGTVYRARLLEPMPPADPTLADTQQLIFSLPGHVTLTKDATLVVDPSGGSPAAGWLLEYQVQGDDGSGSPAGLFHAAEGAMRIQAFLRWSNTGSPSAEEFQWHSDVATVDTDDQELRIFPNL